jgi:hypothetical protein
VILGTDHGTSAWHNGGNSRSYGEVKCLLDARAMMFWIANRIQNSVAGWNFETLARRLTQAVANRLLVGG